MKNYMDELIENGMGTVIDINIDKIIKQDETYLKDQSDTQELKERLLNTLTDPQKQIFEDYIACAMSGEERACHIAYLTGVKNTIQFLEEK